MKKTILITFIGFFILSLGFFINNFVKKKDTDKEVIALFDYYKPLPNLDMFIGSSVTDTYNYLNKNLTNDCSVLYGAESMDIGGIIRHNNSKDDISNYINEKNIQIICNGLKYKFLDKQEKPKEEKITLVVNVCNFIVLDYYISANLDVATFGETPMIFNDWLKYYSNYSSKKPVIEKNKIEEEFLGVTSVYELDKKYWYHDLLNHNIEKNTETQIPWPEYGNIFLEILLKKNIEDVNDKEVNILKFRSYLSHRVRGETC